MYQVAIALKLTSVLNTQGKPTHEKLGWEIIENGVQEDVFLTHFFADFSWILLTLIAPSDIFVPKDLPNQS